MRKPSGISVFGMTVAFVEGISRSGCCGCQRDARPATPLAAASLSPRKCRHDAPDTRGGMAEERSQAALNWMHRGLSSSSPGSLAVSRARRRGLNVA